MPDIPSEGQEAGLHSDLLGSSAWPSWRPTAISVALAAEQRPDDFSRLAGACPLSFDPHSGQPCRLRNPPLRQLVFYQAGPK